jgi:hypothetical protein
MSKLLLQILLSSEIYFEINVGYLYGSLKHSLRRRTYIPIGTGGRKSRDLRIIYTKLCQC